MRAGERYGDFAVTRSHGKASDKLDRWILAVALARSEVAERTKALASG